MQTTPSRCRPAEAGDLPALTELCRQLGYPATEDETRSRLRGLLKRAEDQAVWVADDGDGTVVGWVHVFAAHRLESGPFAEIGGLVVAEEHRGRGVGRQLLTVARGWALARGVRELRVRSNVVRERAHRFYEAAGFRRSKEQAVFVQRIEEERGSTS